MAESRTYLDWYSATPDLTALSTLVLAYKEDKGFPHPSPETLSRDLLHIISELVEANEEARKNAIRLYSAPDERGIPKPEGFGVELAQAFVLLVGLMRAWNLDLRDLVGLTMAYNEGRPRLHGKLW